MEFRAIFNMDLDLKLAALALYQDDLVLFSLLYKDLLRLDGGTVKLFRDPALIDAEPAPGTHGDPGECFCICHISPSSLPIQY